PYFPTRRASDLRKSCVRNPEKFSVRHQSRRTATVSLVFSSARVHHTLRRCLTTPLAVFVVLSMPKGCCTTNGHHHQNHWPFRSPERPHTDSGDEFGQARSTHRMSSLHIQIGAGRLQAGIAVFTRRQPGPFLEGAMEGTQFGKTQF